MWWPRHRPHRGDQRAEGDLAGGQRCQQGHQRHRKADDTRATWSTSLAETSTAPSPFATAAGWATGWRGGPTSRKRSGRPPNWLQGRPPTIPGPGPRGISSRLDALARPTPCRWRETPFRPTRPRAGRRTRIRPPIDPDAGSTPLADSLQVLAYYDFEQRVAQDGGSFHVDTFDVQAQDGFSPAETAIASSSAARPTRQPLRHSQRPIAIVSARHRRPQAVRRLRPGFDRRHPHAPADRRPEAGGRSLFGVSFPPDVRLAWNPRSDLLIWAAASLARSARRPRSTRTSSRRRGPKVFLTGNPNFRPETLTAFRVETRSAVTSRASVSASAYYNLCDVTAQHRAQARGPSPRSTGATACAEKPGVEAWADWQALSWWRPVPSVAPCTRVSASSLGPRALLGVQQVADDPEVQAGLKSSIDLGSVVTLDTELRYVSALPGPVAPAYVELNARLGFNPDPRLQLSVDGFNLLHARHQGCRPRRPTRCHVACSANCDGGSESAAKGLAEPHHRFDPGGGLGRRHGVR